MRYPPEVLEQVRNGIDLVTLISEQVRLVKSGRSWKGLCPFHDEKTPSFMVNPERGVYHCFGCGKGGNAITFLMEHDKLPFGDAVRTLAERAGIPLPSLRGDPEREGETQALMSCLAFAAEFYRERFLHPTAGEPARAYLRSRDLPEELAERFQLGFAPAGWTQLRDVARKRYPAEILVRSGMLIAKEDGTHYDRFRNRIMVPVQNTMGRVVGFGGRVLAGDEPKYINSPESPVYQKGQILFGLPQAREALNRLETAILVEGYLDQLRVFGAGFENVVAVAGTAFTPNQALLLKRYVKRVVLLFDGDRAGGAAAWKNAHPCVAAGLEVLVVGLPEEHDPDSFIRERGEKSFKEMLDQATGIVEYARFGLLPRLGREETLREIVTLIRQIPDAIRRRLLIQETAEKFRFDESTLVRAVESSAGESRKDMEWSAPTGSRTDRATAVAEPAERNLVALLATHAGLHAQLGPLDGIEFRDPFCRELARLMQADPEGRLPVDQILESEPDSPLARGITQLLADPALVDGAADPVRWGRDCVRSLKLRAIQDRLDILNQEMQSPEMNRDPERSQSILMERMALVRERRTLMTGAGH